MWVIRKSASIVKAQFGLRGCNFKPRLLRFAHISATLRCMEEIRIHKWSIRLPKSRPLRILVGILLIIGGIFGFLPILGFWMIPLGLTILSFEIPLVRRWRRRFVVWLRRTWENRRGARQRKAAEAQEAEKTPPAR